MLKFSESYPKDNICDDRNTQYFNKAQVHKKIVINEVVWLTTQKSKQDQKPHVYKKVKQIMKVLSFNKKSH